jgi:hypothetical protein
MKIKAIKCSRLNNYYKSKISETPAELEVVVQFEDSGRPIGIMCDKYIESYAVFSLGDYISSGETNKTTCCCKVDKKPCTYSRWKDIKVVE